MAQNLRSVLETDEIYKTVSFVVADARQPDCPIVFASPSFFEVTQYTPQETLGRNCRFLQGKDTSRRAISEIRDAVREERETNVCLLNYRKDGTSFWNAFHLHPVQDSSGKVTFFVGVQCDVTVLFMVPDPGTNLDEAALSEANRRSEDAARRLAENIGSHARDLLSQSASSKTCVSDSIATPLAAGLGNIDHAFVLTDASDLKMQYCSRGFIKMMGYPADELLGKDYIKQLGCRDSDQTELERIQQALHAKPPTPVSAVVKCRRKNNEVFHNALYIAPVNGSDGQVAYFCGVQTEIKDADLSRGADATAPADTSTIVRLRQRGVIGAVRVATRGLANKDLSRKRD